MKNRLLLYYKKVKKFITKKRKFPISINFDIALHPKKDKWELINQINDLHHSNNVLRKEIKKLKVIIEIRNMGISLNRKGDC